MSGPWIGAFVTLTVLVLLLTVAMIGLMRRTSAVLERTESMLATASGSSIRQGIAAGTAVPAFEAATSTGESWTMPDPKGGPLLMLFVDPGCVPCETLMDEIRSEPASLNGASLVLVSKLIDARLRELERRHTIVLDAESVVSDAFGTSITPNAFAVSADGVVVARQIPGSSEDLARLAAQLQGGIEK